MSALGRIVPSRGEREQSRSRQPRSIRRQGEVIQDVANAMLDLVKVSNTKQQAVAGTMYYITLEATDGGVKQAYEAKVWAKPWQNFKEVQEFKLIGNDPVEGSA